MTRLLCHRSFLLLLLMGAAPARAATAQPTHVVIAQLVDWPREQHVPHCGRRHSVVLMDYEVLRIEKGEPLGPRFWVAVSCPELARGSSPTAVKRFVAGDVHRLELTEAYPVGLPRPRPQRGVTSYFWPLRTDTATR